MEPPDRIVTVTTIKDTAQNVRRFLDRNLSAGVDHMVVFLDAPSPRVAEILDDHPDVTLVRAHSDYWQGARPERPSDRCRINVNLANTVLATVPSVRWVFHIDGDEALAVDRDELLASDAEVLRLHTLEAVASLDPPGDEPVAFKRMPSESDLERLAADGTIHRPHPWAYFRGHFEGKPGSRPSLRRRFGVHSVFDPSGEELPAATLESARLLHYESWSYGDFVQRWKDYAPDQVHLRTHRGPRKNLGLAVHKVIDDPALNDAARRRRLRQMFANRVADDVAALEAAGMLVPPPVRDQAPRSLSSSDRRHLRAVVGALRKEDLTAFTLEAPPAAPIDALRNAAARLAANDRAISEALSGYLDAHR